VGLRGTRQGDQSKLLRPSEFYNPIEFGMQGCYNEFGPVALAAGIAKGGRSSALLLSARKGLSCQAAPFEL